MQALKEELPLTLPAPVTEPRSRAMPSPPEMIAARSCLSPMTSLTKLGAWKEMRKFFPISFFTLSVKVKLLVT